MFKMILAPMCGITDEVFRTLCFEQGCDLAYTEMISAMGYLCAPEQRATRELMVRGEKEPVLVLQLFGRDPDTVAEAAKRICALKIYDGIDLNMGCPAKKIAPSGEGAGLMRTPETAREMMRKTVAACDVPVSVKMRLGYDAEHINVLTFAKMAEEEGVSSITVHGRTREQQYSGNADWAAIAEVRRSVRIPVYGNGDIYTAADGIARQAESGVDGVMIGRGAMGNPWIFRQMKEAAAGRTPAAVSVDERKETALRHYRMMLERKPEKIAVREMRKHIGWYIRGLKGASRFRNEMNLCPDAGKAMDMLERFFYGAAGESGGNQEETE